MSQVNKRERTDALVATCVVALLLGLAVWREEGWADTVMLSGPSFGACTLAFLGGGGFGAAILWAIWSPTPENSLKLGCALLAAPFLAGIAGIYFLNWVHEVASFRGVPLRLERVKFEITSKNLGACRRRCFGRAPRPSVGISTGLGGTDPSIPISIEEYATMGEDRNRNRGIGGKCVTIYIQRSGDEMRAFVLGALPSGESLKPRLHRCGENADAL